jgi:phenylacetate-CoA ligase
MPSLTRTLKSLAAFRAGAPALFRAYAANERRDRRALAALQVERLKSLLVHAGESATFWRRRFARYGIHPEQVRSIDDLAALPLLEERDRRAYARELLAGGTPEPGWVGLAGLDPATAAPLWLDPPTRRERQVDELRHVTWAGLDWRAPRAELTGRAEHGGVLPRAGGTLRAALRGGLWLHPLRLPADAEAFAARAARAGAELLTGPPSALLTLATATGGASAFRPRAVQSFGECLSEERRDRLQEAFGAPVYDAWRTRELGEAAHDCDVQNGMHVTMERVLLEFVRDGRPVPDGEEGEIVATALDGRAQPLLRWRTGDVGCRIPEPECPCGRTSERILVTDGRIGTLVTSPSGIRIHGDWFDWLFGTLPQAAGGRALQDSAGRLVLEVVARAGWSEDQAASLRAALLQVDPAFEVEVRRVAALPESPDGRRNAVVSAAPLVWSAGAPEPALAGRRG